MRELRFRIWIKDEERYYDEADEESYTIVPNGNVTYTSEPYEEDGMWFTDTVSATEDVTVEQYTGLKDKNGKEIYEGDIVERRKLISAREMAVPGWGKDHTEIRRAVIVYKHGMFYGRSITAGINTNYPWDELEADFEIIGNIHENTELLEEEE